MTGTMVLVLMGCGSAVFAGNAAGAVSEGVGTLGVAFAFGLSVIAMAYTIGKISGCHINPAITFGVWLSGRMGGKDAAMYMLFQVIGAVIGSAVLFHRRIRVHIHLRARGARNHRQQERSRRLRRTCNRTHPRAHPHCLHTYNRHFSQPCQEHRTGNLRRRQGPVPVVALHRGTSGRSGIERPGMERTCRRQTGRVFIQIKFFLNLGSF